MTNIISRNDISIFKKINLNRTTVLGALGIVFLVSTIGVFRYRGEFYTIKMYNQRALKQELPAIYAGYKALSFAYSIDPTSVPIYW